MTAFFSPQMFNFLDVKYNYDKVSIVKYRKVALKTTDVERTSLHHSKFYQSQNYANYANDNHITGSL